MRRLLRHTASIRTALAGGAACSRRRQPRALLISVLLLIAALVATPGAPASGAREATPAGTLNHAGLIVEHGDGRLTYALISFAEPELTGIELLERSGLEFASVPFGGLGDAICQVEGEGCDLTTCRRTVCQTGSDAPFWHFLALTEGGTWDAVDLGASSFKVRDGDIVAWSWTNGPVGIPPTTIAEIAERVGVAPEQLAAADAEPGAAVWSAGGSANGDDQDWLALAAGVVALLLIAALGFVLVRRRTRLGGAP